MTPLHKAIGRLNDEFAKALVDATKTLADRLVPIAEAINAFRQEPVLKALISLADAEYASTPSWRVFKRWKQRRYIAELDEVLFDLQERRR